MGLLLEKMYPKESRTISPSNGRGPLSTSDQLWQKVLDNLGLVGKVLARFVGSRLPMDELIQIGIIGLYKAALFYEPTKGSFSNFAIVKINGEILAALKKDYHMAEISKRFQEAVPTDSSPDPLKLLQSRQDEKMVREMLGKLGERDRQILEPRYGDEPVSKQEVGRRLGVTGEAIRQTEEKLLERLKKMISRAERSE